MMDEPAELQSRPTPWKTVILVCRKCGKKLDGGFGPKQRDRLRTELRKALHAAGRRREVKVIETSCFGVCPKRGVTALNASRPGVLHVVPAGASPEQTLRALLVATHKDGPPDAE